MAKMKLTSEHLKNYLGSALQFTTRNNREDKKTMVGIVGNNVAFEYPDGYLGYISIGNITPILELLTDQVIRDIFKTNDNYDHFRVISDKYSMQVRVSVGEDNFTHIIYYHKSFSECPTWVYQELVKRNIDVNNLIKKKLAKLG